MQAASESRELQKEKSEMRLLQYIAPRRILINGETSSCECTDVITCAHCVQANLLEMKKEFKSDEERKKNALTILKKMGVRKSAQYLEVNEGMVRQWIRTKNVPRCMVERFANNQTNEQPKTQERSGDTDLS